MFINILILIIAYRKQRSINQKNKDMTFTTTRGGKIALSEIEEFKSIFVEHTLAIGKDSKEYIIPLSLSEIKMRIGKKKW